MPGIVGSTNTDGALAPMVESVAHENWYEEDSFREDGGELGLVHHGRKDPGGRTVWRGDDGVGVVYGVVPNREELGLSEDDLFEALLDRPSVVLPKLDGPFALAVMDRRNGSVTLAMDRIGTRPLYYAETDAGLAFASEIKAVLTRLDDAELDPDGVGDLVSLGFVVGEKTIVDGVTALQSGTMARYEDGELEVTRYWEPECGRLDPEGYPERTMDALGRSVGDVADTLDGRVGLFLSGGLDSRMLAALLRDEYGTFRTLTYDSNPSNGANIEPARRTAAHLGVDNERIDIRSGDYHEDIETVVELTDGMTSWSYLINLDFILHDLHDEVDVTMEAASLGELLGDQIYFQDLVGAPDATEALWRTYPHLDVDRVNELVTADVDPKESIRTAVEKSSRAEQRHRVIDTWLWTFNANSHYRNKNVIRSQTGMRLPFAAEEFVDAVATMPHEEYRRHAFPFTRGKIPRAMSPLKRDVVLQLDDELADLTYERTLVGASKPMWLHEAAHVGKQLYWQYVTGRPTENLCDWTREVPETRAAIEGWLEDAAERDVFDAEAVRELSAEHFDGEEDHLEAIAPITAVELFCRKYLDGSASADVAAENAASPLVGDGGPSRSRSGESTPERE